MSRPFSYNDENFTVIGNMLFIHRHYDSNLFTGIEFLKIPPEIKKTFISQRESFAYD